MNAPTMPVKAIKRIMNDELDAFYKDSFQLVKHNILSDVACELVTRGYLDMRAKLAASTTYDELEEYVHFAGYRMSLQDWIDSL